MKTTLHRLQNPADYLPAPICDYPQNTIKVPKLIGLPVAVPYPFTSTAPAWEALQYQKERFVYRLTLRESTIEKDPARAQRIFQKRAWQVLERSMRGIASYKFLSFGTPEPKIVRHQEDFLRGNISLIAIFPVWMRAPANLTSAHDKLERMLELHKRGFIVENYA